MSLGPYKSEDDLIRDALDALRRQHDDLAAIRQAIADMEAGDQGVEFDEFLERFRTQRGLTSDA
jgi:Arc/MetJ-type ribon-helix-helix transcriptional regulator